jgi:hypothetical protein
MNTQEYLTEVLQIQKLADESQELKDLQQHRADVEKLLRREFNASSPTIRYGGSKAKDTLIKESFDLDITCYFASDDTSAGTSLKDIYDNVAKALEKDYFLERKTSSLRLLAKDTKLANRDFHIDVVPGRYVDEGRSDCYIHQNGNEKERLKTNLETHVKNSGVIDAVRLLKLWKVRKTIHIKQFVWELIVIKLLKDKKGATLESQLKHVWTSLRDTKDPIAVEDPANPSGNDLSGVVESAWPILSSLASSTLSAIESSGWETTFGSVKRTESIAARTASLAQAATASPLSTRPWAR